MSYVVTVYDDITVWFENAWADLFSAFSQPGSPLLTDMWYKAYDNIIEFVGGDEWKITFPSEQDYIWFVLKWS